MHHFATNTVINKASVLTKPLLPEEHLCITIDQQEKFLWDYLPMKLSDIVTKECNLEVLRHFYEFSTNEVMLTFQPTNDFP